MLTSSLLQETCNIGITSWRISSNVEPGHALGGTSFTLRFYNSRQFSQKGIGPLDSDSQPPVMASFQPARKLRG
jgi:hypothetical protein